MDRKIEKIKIEIEVAKTTYGILLASILALLAWIGVNYNKININLAVLWLFATITILVLFIAVLKFINNKKERL